MIFDYFNNSLKFINENKNIDNLKQDCFSAQEFLKDKGEVNIYIENSYAMLTVFLAALYLDKKPTILSENLKSTINDSDYFEFMQRVKGCEYRKNDKILNRVFYIKTSGSSGKSKAIEKTLQQVLDESIYLSSFYNISSQDIFTSSISCNHFFGLIFKLFMPLIIGAKIDTRLFLVPSDIAKIKNQSIFITSPVILKNMTDSSFDFYNIKKIFSAGSALKRELRAKLEKITNADTINIYGSTETGIIAYDKGGCLKAFPEVNVSSDDESRLVVKSPWASFCTNDLVRIENDKLFLLGRADMMIKQNDRRIHIDVLTNNLLEHKYVKDCICNVVDGELCSLIVLSETGRDDFRKYGKKHIILNLKKFIYNDFKNCIKKYKIIDKIERNATSKFSLESFKCAFNKKIMPDFKLVKQSGDDDTVEFIGVLNPECYFFQGHFSSFAVTPGYIQLEIIFNLMFSLGIDVYNSNKLKDIKFSGFLRPLDEVLITITKNDNYASFKIISNNKVCSSGKIVI